MSLFAVLKSSDLPFPPTLCTLILSLQSAGVAVEALATHWSFSFSSDSGAAHGCSVHSDKKNLMGPLLASVEYSPRVAERPTQQFPEEPKECS